HPTIKDHALIATGAKVLDSITTGEHSEVGAGSVVLHDVPDHSTVVGIPGKVVVQHGKRVRRKLDQHTLTAPAAERCNELEAEVKLLREEITKLKEGMEKDVNYDI